jgi:hypothetical protein
MLHSALQKMKEKWRKNHRKVKQSVTDISALTSRYLLPLPLGSGPCAQTLPIKAALLHLSVSPTRTLILYRALGPNCYHDPYGSNIFQAPCYRANDGLV